MADEKPINAKPFSSSFSFNKSTTTSISDSASRQISNGFSYQSLTSTTSSLPMTGSRSMSDLLGTSTTLPSIDSILKPLPVSADISTLSTLVIPQSTSLSSFLGGNTQFVSKSLSISSNPILGSFSDLNLVTTPTGAETAEASTTVEPDNTNNLIDFFNNLKPNQLNDYPQATYHLKLFMCKSELVLNKKGSIDQWREENPDIFSGDNIIVIAESGVTAGLYIESFSVTDIVSIAPTFNSSGVNAKMVIKEPLGANFIDYYNGAITELGYETRIQAPVFMEISFRGYDENGNYMPVNDIGDKIYRFTTTNIDANFVSSGTSYDLDFVVVSDIARQTAIANTSNNVTVQGKSVKDFYDKLVEEWNKAGKDVEQDESQPPAPTTGTAGAVPSGNTGEASTPPTESEEKPTPTEKNEFEVVVDDSCVEYKDCLSWEVGKATAPDRLRTANTTFEDGKGTIEATWGPGSDRIGILLDVLYSTKNSQTLIVNGKQDDEVKPGSKELGGTSYLPEIDIFVEQKDYNSETHTYNKKITYIIQERKTTQITPTPKEINEASNDEKALINKLAYVRRRYDYFGTGKNTEITGFNIKMSSNFMINLPAYNAQKRTSVADNPGISTEAIQSKQVADGNKVQLAEGVKKPTPINPDNVTVKDGVAATSGTQTSKVDQSSDIVVNLSSSSILSGSTSPSASSFNSLTSINLPSSLNDTFGSMAKTNQEFNSLPSIDQLLNKPAYDKSLRQIWSSTDSLNPNSLINGSIGGISSQFSSQIDSFSLLSKPLDSLSLTSLTSPINLASNSQLSGTLLHGANSDYVSNASADPVSRANEVSNFGNKYLEDFARVKADSPKADVASFRAVVSTDINNRGGYNLDDTSGIGKSYVTALLSGMYGQKADMATVAMDVRGDPLWLGVRNKATRDQSSSQKLKDKDGNDVTPSDHKVLLTVVFPTMYDENTGLAIPNKMSEGYTALYNLRSVESSFEGGKFTQKLDLYQDLSTEQVRKYIDPAGSADI